MNCVIRKLVDYTFSHYCIKEGIDPCMLPSFQTYQDTKHIGITSLEQRYNILCKTMDKKMQLLWITITAMMALNTMLDGVIIGSHGNVKAKINNMLRFEKPKVQVYVPQNIQRIYLLDRILRKT